MGHKGVSKRKPAQIKSKPLSSSPASGTVSSLMTESLPDRTHDAGKAASSVRNGEKPAWGGKKNIKKG